MKLKTTIATLAAVLFAVSTYAQGTVTFNSTLQKRVSDSRTGTFIENGLAVAGLYFNTDLSATPDLTVPDDGWQLASVTPVGGTFPGLYSGGTVTIDGQIEGTTLLFQVRAWSVGFASYAEAYATGDQNVVAGGSNTGALRLGGATAPDATSSFVQAFTVSPVPEPSTVVLGLLGGFGALVALRRRK
jgi:hypothetical protein